MKTCKGATHRKDRFSITMNSFIKEKASNAAKEDNRSLSQWLELAAAKVLMGCNTPKPKRAK